MAGPIGVTSLLDRTRILVVIDMAVVKQGATRAAFGHTISLPNIDGYQSRSLWCWAAVSMLVSHSYDSTSAWIQCTIAGTVYPAQHCCVPPPPGDNHPCNCTAKLSLPLGNVGCFSTRDGRTNLAIVTEQINAEKMLPIHISWPRDENGKVAGHYTTIHGYTSSSDDDALVIFDPRFGPQQPPLSTMNGNYVAHGTWDDSYITLGHVDDN